jgi:nucleotide-binding universal stress UspA family protein
MTAQHMHEATYLVDSIPRLAPQGPSVLFATDESDAARAGEEWIRRLRWARTPAIDVLTVAPRPGWASGLGLQTYRTAVREAVNQARETELVEAQRVANAVGSRLQRAGIRVRVWARTGEAADEIVRASRLEAMDLVVIGGSGRSSRALLWGRSVSSQVVRQSDVPVLVAHPPPRGDDRLPHSIAILDVDHGATAGALDWLGDVGWLEETRVTLARLEGPDGRPSSATVRSGTAAGDPALATAGMVVLPSDRDRSIDALRALIDQAEIDLAVIPRAQDRRVTDLALRIADVARVSVLLTPNPPRPR